MYDPEVNVEAGTLLLSRLRDRIEKPTPEKIGTLWNSLKEKETTVFGNYIGKLYQEKPWKKLDLSSGPDMDRAVCPNRRGPAYFPD